MNDENEKGAATNDAPRKGTDKEIVTDGGGEAKAIRPRVIDPYGYRKAFSKRDCGWRPYVEKPSNALDAARKVKDTLVYIKTTIEERIYAIGCWLLEIKATHPREYDKYVREHTTLSKTSAWNAIKYVEQCEDAGKKVDYDPNGRKRSTVERLLGNDLKNGERKLEKPKSKDSENDWTEDSAANLLLEYFIRLTHHCSIEEKESVANKSLQALQDHIAIERDEYEEGEDENE